MAHTTGDVRRVWLLGAALAVLTAVACLGFAASRDVRSISLAELAQTEALLMSCESGLTSSAEPLWCADPSAPQCAPAAPDAPHVALAAAPDVLLQRGLLPERNGSYVLVPWPSALPEATLRRVEQARLERPPRA